MDIVADILASLRLNGCVILDAETSGGWCLLSKFTPEDCAPFMPVPGQIVAFHYIRSGRVWAKVDGEAEPVEVAAGSILLFPRNDRHMIYTDNSIAPIDSHAFIMPGYPLPEVRILNTGDAATFFCGFLGVAGGNHPLLDSLPPMLVIGDDGGPGNDWLESSMRFLAGSPHSPEMVARLAELFFAQAVRRYLAALPDDASGWLAGLRDPTISRALSIIHDRFADELDVDTLAREAGVSRTVLGERFVSLLGEPPMRYCARWRMRVAANMLRDRRDNTANIAYAVGFNSEAAFSRAFKREYGEPPASWRRKAVAA